MIVIGTWAVASLAGVIGIASDSMGVTVAAVFIHWWVIAVAPRWCCWSLVLLLVAVDDS